MLQGGSTENIARRYRHLFRLPSTPTSVLYASIPVLALELIVRVAIGSEMGQIILYGLFTELLLLLCIEIDYLILRRMTKLASFRRLSSSSIVGNSIWLLLTIVASTLFVVTGNEDRFVALIVLGMFFAIAFRALVFGAVFLDRPIHALPQATIQPIILILPIALISTKTVLATSGIIASCIGGAVSITAVELYIHTINKKADFGGFRPLELFQAFLKAWIIEDASSLEHFLEIVSKNRVVNTTMIRIEPSTGKGKSALLIVPGIHPGPFYPVGSSNLPSVIFEILRTQTTVPLTVHSISDHDLNLPSKSEVDRYVKSLMQYEELDHGMTMTKPVVKSKNKASVLGFALGSTAIIALTLAPYGMEDFPVRVRNDIEKISRESGFMCEFIIDTHNSEGSKPNEVECDDAVEAASKAIHELKRATQYNFTIRFAHSSEIGKALPADIGPAGVGMICFEVKETSFSLIIVDANNSKIGFREDVLEKFAKRNGSRILELCTSDTHVTAAKTSDAKGYVALGDLTSPDDFVSLLSFLEERSKINIDQGSYSTSKVASSVKTIGGEVLNEFSGLLDKTSRISKNGAIALGLIILLVTAAVAIV